ncbi:MAG: PD-(D/E)XK nuclease family protein [Actinobacteria bacterium]|nr:PD-(D/E)XK nuclease family protein [Actinomycetota bacterium]
MITDHINGLTGSIGELCAGHVLAEKWLLAPSLRVGFQWLDAVTRSGRAVLNLRVKTVAGMALELAAPEMERRGLSLLRGIRAELLTDELLARLRERGGYLARLEAGPGLARAASATLRDLRLAGLSAEGLSIRLFEVAAKGSEIASLLGSYEKELDSRNLVDLAGALRIAARQLETDGAVLPHQALVAAPADMLEEMHGLERDLWEAVPADRRVVLEVDRPGGEGAGGGDDRPSLAWVAHPGDAPSPEEDGSVEIFRAVGEVNEVREALRRCAAAGIPFDQVEILHTDASTYVPLIYEVCALLAPDAGAAVPVTFLEGIPVRYSRPGRALAALLSWIAEDFPQAVLVRMVQDGLLDLGPHCDVWSFSRMGALLRALPIGKGRKRYLAAIDSELDSLQWRISQPEPAESGEDNGKRSARLERRMDMLRSLRVVVADLLTSIPQSSDPLEVLSGMADFLTGRARAVSELDEYGRMRLLDDIWELSTCLQEDGIHPAASLNIPGWLVQLAATARVEGKGPRPGCLYVAPLAAGGHSGRPHTFILGLDDGRFPGSGLQDPLLLDGERAAICEDLPTAAGRLAASLEGFARLAARIRGRITLSYCCRSLTDDRDMFPSPVLLAAYRAISGDREGVQDDLIAWIPNPPASFAPDDAMLCLDPTEWWLHRLCGRPAPEDPEETVATAFPHLGRGLEARRARESDIFTAYDGYVPEAGADLDPTLPQGPVLSASRLETLGRCPLEYFFAYVLAIEPPDEYTIDPYRWLDPTEKGSLLHTVFQRFYVRLREEDRLPSFEQDWDTLQDILEDEIGSWTKRKPPPSREVFAREVDDLRLSTRIFLQEEEHCRERRPLYFEVAIGMEADAVGNPVDSPHPVLIELPGGRTIRTRGFIDRIDELGDAGSARFGVCDYKTGSTYGYERSDPFRQGRLVQNLIYLMQAQSRLAECHPGAEVESFQYFFPSTRAHGERIEWGSSTLAGGIAVLEALCDMLAAGCFPFTDDSDDLFISDFRDYFGDIAANVEAVRRKLCNPHNEVLAPFRELRGYEG